MPLHLLGKKSWNVYNADNVARVQADEAAAAAAEHAQEQRMQEADAARRLAILRGETPPPAPAPEPAIDPASTRFARRDKASATGFAPRKRKRHGEDDTDFEMRLATERAELGGAVAAELGGGKRREVELVGKDGHIDLVGAPPSQSKSKDDGKNPEYEKDAAKKQRDLADQYTMRFANAAGRDGLAAGEPWYASSASNRKPAIVSKEDEVGMKAPTTNVWGRDDPKRQDREVKRIVSNDPLAMMKLGAKKVREIDKERRKESGERARELEELRRDEQRREKRRKHDSHRHRSDRSERSERQHDDKGERRSRHGSDRTEGERRHRRRGREEDRESGQRRTSDPSSLSRGDGENRTRHRGRRDGDDER